MNEKFKIIETHSISLHDVLSYMDTIREDLTNKACDYLYTRWVWCHNNEKVFLNETITNGIYFGLNKSKAQLLLALRRDNLSIEQLKNLTAFFESGKVKKYR